MKYVVSQVMRRRRVWHSKLKAQSSNEECENDGNDDESDEEFALFVRRFKRFMNMKTYGKKGQSSKKKNPFEDRKCFECGELSHIVINCPNKKKNKKDKNENDNNKKKKFLKKKKNGQAYYVE